MRPVDRIFGGAAPFLRYSSVLLLTAFCVIAVIDRIDLNGLRYSFARIDPGHMAIAITALSGGFALSCLRIKLAASDLGYRLSARHAVAALSLGQLGGSAFF